MPDRVSFEAGITNLFITAKIMLKLMITPSNNHGVATARDQPLNCDLQTPGCQMRLIFLHFVSITHSVLINWP